jgi:anaerobic magnesium-protoporphyrin IX monomethyl ester cyclase
MNTHTVVFIASREYDNLGIGYMAALLSGAGFTTKVIDFLKNKDDILRTVEKINPLIIGFSVIFEYHIKQFIDLVISLREKGINCHFTSGGHYASLKPEELFDFIPLFDSIVRFEGEYTMLELAECIRSGTDWKRIDGIVYKENGKLVINHPRPFEKDLDTFPFPLRPPLKSFAFENKFATIIAGRGCVHNCSFCNTGKFYGQSTGFLKRIRRPEMVVNEIAWLYKKRNCPIFLFLDDDFPLKSPQEPGWLKRFCDELRKKRLNDKILWKICCRPDEVEEESFTLMKENGLFLVFLGIEDGTDTGLKRLNKHMTIEESLNGIHILKKLQIGFNYGFLLFQPWSTFRSVNDNLDFLRKICGDGCTTVSYLKLMPYYETAVEKELLKEGRLKISPGIRDYDFIGDSMNHFYEFVADCFKEWLWNNEGLENLTKWVKNFFLVYPHLFSHDEDFASLERSFTGFVSESNLFCLDTLKELSGIFESGLYLNEEHGLLKTWKEKITLKHRYFKERILDCSDELYAKALNHAIQSVLKNVY